MMPQRIQRKRVKGWRMPENAVNICRPSKWGNPFKVHSGRTAEEAVSKYRYWMMKTSMGRKLFDLAKVELKGKDLACFCKEGETCHGDYLLEIANSDKQIHAVTLDEQVGWAWSDWDALRFRDI